MRHVRDVIRMKSAGMPSREIARRVGAAPSTVRLTIRRFEASRVCPGRCPKVWTRRRWSGCSSLRRRRRRGAGSPSRTGRRSTAS